MALFGILWLTVCCTLLSSAVQARSGTGCGISGKMVYICFKQLHYQTTLVAKGSITCDLLKSDGALAFLWDAHALQQPGNPTSTASSVTTADLPASFCISHMDLARLTLPQHS